MTFPVQAKKENILYCWLNDDDVRECGNYVSPLYSQNGFWKCRRGGECEYVDPAPTAEELAIIKQEKKEDNKRQEQQKSDDALLALFSRERDIENRRNALLDSINGQIQPIQSILEGLRGNLEDLKESYNRSKDNQDVSENQVNTIKRNINSIEKRIIDTEDTLQNKLDEKIETNIKYDIYLQRYLEINLRRMQRKASSSPAKLQIYQEQIDEIKQSIDSTLQEYTKMLKERKNNPSLSEDKKTLIQEKIERVLQQF